jgi:hypothetical protein
MADELHTSQSPSPRAESPAPQAMFWLACAAMFGMLVLAALALIILSRNSGQAPAPVPITISNIGNTLQEHPASPAPMPEPAPAWRPDRASEPDAHRMSGQMVGAPQMLPGALATPTPVSGTREDAAKVIRADTQAPPFYSTLSPVAKVMFRVRGLPGGLTGLKGPIPFRIHEWQPMPDGRVAAVEASVPQSAAPDEAQYSYLPEFDYKSSSGKGKILGITLNNPRKNSVVNELRAPKGYQFLVADIAAKNLSHDPISLDPDMFEIQDSDHIPYLPNPELLSADFPQAPIQPQKTGSFTVAFLVPADASLVSFVAREPGDGLISSPLNPR